MRNERKHYYEGGKLFLYCNMCKSFKEELEFNKRSRDKFGRRSECRECQSAYSYKYNRTAERRKHKLEYDRGYRNKNKDYLNAKRRDKKIYLIHNKTDCYIRKHNIRPDRCQICGKIGKVEAHHPDYSKWYEVVFVCMDCHNLIESGKIKDFSTTNVLYFNK